MGRDDEQARRRLTWEALERDDFVDCAFLTGELQEWKILSGGNYNELSRKAQLTRRTVHEIAHGQRQRVQKLTAAKLLRAMGQSLRPELERAYKSWVSAGRP